MDFHFQFTLSLSTCEPEPDEKDCNSKYEEAKIFFRCLGECFGLEIHDAPESRLYRGKEFFCITVSYRRQIAEFRSAHNLLKILEASLNLFSETQGYRVLHLEYPGF